MSSFTPGPWHPDYGIHFERAITIQSEDKITVATIWLIGEQTEANARLIAAAPELYEALERIMTILEKHTHQDPHGYVKADGSSDGIVTFTDDFRSELRSALDAVLEDGK